MTKYGSVRTFTTIRMFLVSNFESGKEDFTFRKTEGQVAK